MSNLHFGIMIGAFPSLDRCVELSKLIEAHQFDSIHGVDGAGSWDPYVLMHLMAEHTSKIPLRLSIVNPYYLHPVKIALFAATLQVASKGRFGVTFAAGGQDMLRSLGLDWVHPTSAIREAITVLRTMHKGETTNLRGRVITAVGNDFWFDPPPVVPVYIGCQRKWLMRLAGEVAQGVVIDSAGPDYAPWAFDRLKEGASRVDRDITSEIQAGTFDFHTCPSLSVAEDRDEAFDRVRGSVPYSFQTMSEERRKRTGISLGIVKKIQKLMKLQTKEAFQEAKKFCTNDVIKKLDPVGTPEDVIRYLKRGRDKGYNGYVFRVSTKLERGAEKTLQLFADHVRPNFQ